MSVVAGLRRNVQFLVAADDQRVALGVRLVLAHRRLHLLHVGETVRGIRGHALERDVDQFSLLVGRLDLVVDDRLQTRPDVLAGMRRLSRHDLVQDRPHQVDVRCRPELVKRTVFAHFRRHVRGRASHAVRHPDRRIGQHLFRDGNAPVHQQDFAEIAKHHVLGLQVAMDHAAGVRERDGVRDPHPDFQVLRQPVAGQPRAPRRTLDLLHRIEQLALLIERQIVDRHDVGVSQLARHHGLGQELLALLVVLGQSRRQHLQGDRPVDRFLPGLVHDSHRALAEHPHQFVVGRVRRILAFAKAACQIPRPDHQMAPRPRSARSFVRRMLVGQRRRDPVA